MIHGQHTEDLGHRVDRHLTGEVGYAQEERSIVLSYYQHLLSRIRQSLTIMSMLAYLKIFLLWG